MRPAVIARCMDAWRSAFLTDWARFSIGFAMPAAGTFAASATDDAQNACRIPTAKPFGSSPAASGVTMRPAARKPKVPPELFLI